MTDFIWLEKFTALIQVISAINFAYIFTGFPKKVYGKIFNEEELTNNKFQSFKDGPLTKTEQSIEHLNDSIMIVVNGTDPKGHIKHLKEDLEGYKEKWDEEKKRTQNIIKNIKEAKEINCLFLFISIFCIIDIFNIALGTVAGRDSVRLFIYWVNIISLIFTIWITYKLLFSKWKDQLDKYCYNQTRRYVTYTLLFSLFFTFINELVKSWYGVQFTLSHPLNILIQSLCVILPLVPCTISILYILYNIFCVSFYRERTKLRIRCGLWQLNRRKKKLETAVRHITTELNWGKSDK